MLLSSWIYAFSEIELPVSHKFANMKGGKNVCIPFHSAKKWPKLYRIVATQSHALPAIMTKLLNLGRHQKLRKLFFLSMYHKRNAQRETEDG